MDWKRPTPATKFPEEPRNAISAKQGMDKLCDWAWSHYVAAADKGDSAALATRRDEFIELGPSGFRCLLDFLKQPSVTPDQSLLALQLVEAMNPVIKDATLRRAAVGALLDVRDAAASQEVRDASTQCLKPALDLAIDLLPEDAGMYYFRGDERFGRQEYDAAIDDCTHAIKCKPDFANAHYLRGVAHRAKGDPDAALADYTAALKIEPDYHDVLVMRAATYLELSKPEEAVNDITAAIALRPDEPLQYEIRARAHAVLNNEAASAADAAP